MKTAGGSAVILVAAWVMGWNLTCVHAGNDEGPSDELRQNMDALRSAYFKMLDSGATSEPLQNVMRELRAASRARDWSKAAELVEQARKIPGVFSDAGSGKTAETTPGNSTTSTPSSSANAITMRPPVEVPVGEIKIQMLVWTAAEGDTAKYPAVVVAHDGFEGITSETRKFCDRLAHAGYIVVAPQFRGQGGSEGKIEWAAGEVADLLEAIKYAIALSSFQKGKLCLIGEGHGGVAALLALAQSTDVKYAVIANAPPVLADYIKRSSGGVAEFAALKLGWSVEDREALLARSPLYKAKSIQAGLLLCAGESFNRVTKTDLEGFARVIEGDTTGTTQGRVTLEILSGASDRLIDTNVSFPYKCLVALNKQMKAKATGPIIPGGGGGGGGRGQRPRGGFGGGGGGGGGM